MLGGTKGIDLWKGYLKCSGVSPEATSGCWAPGGAGVYDKIGIVEARASRDHAPTL